VLQITSALLTGSTTAVDRFISARVTPLELVAAKGVSLSVCPSGRLVTREPRIRCSRYRNTSCATRQGDVSSFLRLNFSLKLRGSSRMMFVVWYPVKAYRDGLLAAESVTRPITDSADTVDLEQGS